MKLLKILIVLLFFSTPVYLQADNEGIIDKPTSERLVNDFAQFLSPAERTMLEQKLDTFARNTSTQITIITVDNLNGYDINDYAVRIFEKWGIGQKGKDNGIVMLIKPKTNSERGQIAISVGYGLEDVVTDAVSKRIIEREIIPAFKKGQFFTGINQAVDRLMELTQHKYTADEYIEKTNGSPVADLVAILFFLFVLIFPLFMRRSHSIGRGTSSSFWYIGGFGGGFGSGGSGFGGGGGFGGFGGGMGGGGGASGGW